MYCRTLKMWAREWDRQRDNGTMKVLQGHTIIAIIIIMNNNNNNEKSVSFCFGFDSFKKGIVLYGILVQYYTPDFVFVFPVDVLKITRYWMIYTPQTHAAHTVQTLQHTKNIHIYKCTYLQNTQPVDFHFYFVFLWFWLLFFICSFKFSLYVLYVCGWPRINFTEICGSGLWICVYMLATGGFCNLVLSLANVREYGRCTFTVTRE